MGNLSVITRGPEPDLVEGLESLLAQAKAGEIQAIAYVADRADEMQSGFIGRGIGPAMIGQLQILSSRIVQVIRNLSEG